LIIIDLVLCHEYIQKSADDDAHQQRRSRADNVVLQPFFSLASSYSVPSFSHRYLSAFFHRALTQINRNHFFISRLTLAQKKQRGALGIIGHREPRCIALLCCPYFCGSSQQRTNGHAGFSAFLLLQSCRNGTQGILSTVLQADMYVFGQAA